MAESFVNSVCEIAGVPECAEILLKHNLDLEVYKTLTPGEIETLGVPVENFAHGKIHVAIIQQSGRKELGRRLPNDEDDWDLDDWKEFYSGAFGLAHGKILRNFKYDQDIYYIHNFHREKVQSMMVERKYCFRKQNEFIVNRINDLHTVFKESPNNIKIQFSSIRETLKMRREYEIAFATDPKTLVENPFNKISPYCHKNMQYVLDNYSWVNDTTMRAINPKKESEIVSLEEILGMNSEKLASYLEEFIPENLPYIIKFNVTGKEFLTLNLGTFAKIGILYGSEKYEMLVERFSGCIVKREHNGSRRPSDDYDYTVESISQIF